MKRSPSNGIEAGFWWIKKLIKEYLNLKKHLTEFLGLKDQAQQYGIGGFSIKIFRLAKSCTGKIGRAHV